MRVAAVLAVVLFTCACTSDPPMPSPAAPVGSHASPASATPTSLPITPPAPASASASPAPSGPAAATPPSRFAASTPSNDASLALHRALRADKGNLFFSGASVRTALAMTALGAKGPTLEEMTKAFGLPSDPAKSTAAAKADAQAWRVAAGKAELVVANRLWLDRSAALEASFASMAKDGFGAAPEIVDFGKAPEPSRARVNAWVTDTTKGRIKDLLPPGSVDALTRLVLTNAIYFKGRWATAFDKAQTKDGAFHADAGSVTVPMMHRIGEMAYASNDEVELVQLDYKDSTLALLVALPRPSAKLADMESEISGGEVDAWAKSLATRKVDLTMPRWSFSWGRSIKSELGAMGMKTAFTDRADFTGISRQPKDLYVTDVFHKAFVLVEESGTEAAAATGVVMATRALLQTTTVRVDRPFLFFVRDKKTGEILFEGRVANPRT